MKQPRHTISIVSAALLLSVFVIGCGSSSSLSTHDAARKAALDTIRAGRFDGGRMWTFEDPPMAYFAEEYNFKPDRKWMDDVRLAALRYSGCSASFVSADGLVMTNHHCVRNNLVAVQKEGEKLLESGFFAARLEDERKIPGATLDQLTEIRDVTKEVLGAMDAAKTDDDKVEARRRIIAEIEKRAGDETKLHTQVVTLYNGGKYSLYLYKRYTDIRLVFAPELQAAHFGGEDDNFTYPRYALDCSFLRIYENDKPLQTEHYYKWNAQGAAEGELVFVIGNPGRTSRLSTAEQLEYNRDVTYPFTFRILDERLKLLREYVVKHPEKKDEYITQILGISNGWKSYKGRLSGLRDDVLVQRRRAFDRDFQAEILKRPELKAKYGHIWNEIAESRRLLRSVANDNLGLRAGGLGVAELWTRGIAVVQHGREMKKPEAERLEQFQGQRLQRTLAAMKRAPRPDEDLETMTLANQLRVMSDYLGAKDPIVQYALQGQAPEAAARRLFAQSAIKDSSTYVGLLEMENAAETSQDPFVVMARMAYPRMEKVSATLRGVQAKDQVNATLLGRALYDVYGTSIPPDATFTPRIADGIVKGFEYNGTRAPAHTTFYGLYDRHFSFTGDESWALAPKWKNPPKELNLATPLNFSSTNDIIGGNSGSPMINTSKEVVGLIFDGNIESLPGDFIFAEDAGNRTVSVHAGRILEALRHIYKAARIVAELESGKRPQ